MSMGDGAGHLERVSPSDRRACTESGGALLHRNGHGGVQVIERAAEILRLVACSPRGVTVTAMARRLGLPRSTAHRITQALQAEGLIVIDQERLLGLGPEFAQLAVNALVEVPPSCAIGSRRPSLLDETVVLAQRNLSEPFALSRRPDIAHMLAEPPALVSDGVDDAKSGGNLSGDGSRVTSAANVRDGVALALSHVEALRAYLIALSVTLTSAP